jgi:hypothetical protein
MARVAEPTPREAVGAALYAAGHEQASYQPPRIQVRPPFLGSCTPGWVAENVPGGWVVLAYRPAGILSAADSYAVQAERLEQYRRDVFSAPVWETMYSRREGIPALLVRPAGAP